ncbi:MAG: Crp/Fnr family transcriptional regulator [Pseudomonadota bacterium]
MHELSSISNRKSLKPGQHHVFEGDAARGFANVVNGVGKLARGAADGRTQIVGLLFASDFLGSYGEDAAHAQEPYSIEAATELELCLFPRQAFQEIAARHPGLERRLLARTLSDLEIARDWMVLLGRKTASERVASFLLHVSDRMRSHGCKPTESFELPLNRVDIADHIGLTVETVSRQITRLKKLGAIAMAGPRRVTGIDRDALAEVAGF